jgi:hypothetical protein
MEAEIEHIRRLVGDRQEEALIEKFRELVPQYRNGTAECRTQPEADNKPNAGLWPQSHS